MASFSDIVDRTYLLVKGKHVMDTIPALINQGVNEIAGGMLSNIAQIIVPPLPKLFTIGSVITATDTYNVPMPNNFQRNLCFAVSGVTEIDIAHSLSEFMETSPALNKKGKITEVLEHGRNLYYIKTPDNAEEITLHYYRYPEVMIDDSDVPDGIPEHLQYSLLTNFAAWKAYEIIEDGIEENSPNTLKYRTFFFDALHTLELTIPDYTRGIFI